MSNDSHVLSEAEKAFIEAIGVDSEGYSCLSYQESTKPDEYGYFGYIKFHSLLGTLEEDCQLAEMFENWLLSQEIKYFRGYPDEPDDRPDRRFFLSLRGVEKLKSIREKLGLTIDDLDQA